MTTTNGVTVHHPNLSLGDIHPRLDIDTISILSSQSDSIQQLSYNESDDESKDLVTSRLHNTINQTYQPSALKKDWIMYLTKPTNNNHKKTNQKNQNNDNNESSNDDDKQSSHSSSPISDNDEDEDDDSEQVFVGDPWTINTEQREYYTKQFLNLQKDITSVINGHLAKEFFERSNLLTSELSQIWNLSDVNHDGTLTLAEFCTAMHLVVLRLNGFQLPDELPTQLQPFTPLIDLSDGLTNENWANFQITTNDSPKQFTHIQPIADNHKIVAPVALRLSPPPPPLPPVQTAITKPPPPPPRAPGRTTSIDGTQQPTLPPRINLNDTPQRNPNNSSTNTTPYLSNRTRASLASSTTSQQQQTDLNLLLGQIRDLLQPDHLQELSSITSSTTTTNEEYRITLEQIKSRNKILKGQLKHWEDRLTDLIDKRISLELQLKPPQQ